ncbi:three-helix bundle dimerization domain-containing protein [Kribbella sp. NPDC049174]
MTDRFATGTAVAVRASRPEFEQAPIRDFVPLFVERAAKQRLRTHA